MTLTKEQIEQRLDTNLLTYLEAQAMLEYVLGSDSGTTAEFNLEEGK